MEQIRTLWRAKRKRQEPNQVSNRTILEQTQNESRKEIGAIAFDRTTTFMQKKHFRKQMRTLMKKTANYCLDAEGVNERVSSEAAMEMNLMGRSTRLGRRAPEGFTINIYCKKMKLKS